MNPRPPRPARGFTLIELVLVLLLMAIGAGIVAPALGGWGRGRRLPDAGDELVSTVRWARMKAVSDGVAVRLEAGEGGATYLVSALRGGQWQPVAGEHGVARPLGEGLTMSIARADGGDDPAILMYPDGRMSPATVTIAADRGRTLIYASNGVAEPLRAVEPEANTP